MSEASVTDVVSQVVLEVARQQRPELSATRLEHSLTNDLGLDSLDFAQVVYELEMRLGTVTFSREAASGIVTLGDLVSIYERAAR